MFELLQSKNNNPSTFITCLIINIFLWTLKTNKCSYISMHMSSTINVIDSIITKSFFVVIPEWVHPDIDVMWLFQYLSINFIKCE